MWSVQDVSPLTPTPPTLTPPVLKSAKAPPKTFTPPTLFPTSGSLSCPYLLDDPWYAVP